MRKLKRFLSILLCMSLVLSLPVFALEFPDVKAEDKNAQAIDVLSSLGIVKGYEDGQFKPDKEVTRAELTSLLMRLLNLSITGTSVADSGYTDVANNHWAVYDIKTASSMGIIKGFGDGTFGPESPVTFEQAVKMVVAMLGYESEAINKGGWPDGYVTQGRDLGLLKDAEMAQTSPAPRKIIAQILYNSLEVDLMAEKNPGSENPSYYIKKGQNIMTEYLKISKVTGMLTATPTTRLDNVTSNLTNKQVEITVDGTPVKYQVGNFENAKDMLGLTVVAYVKEDETAFNPVIQHIMTKSKVEELSFDADVIERFNSPTSITILNKDTGRTKDYPIANNAVFIYNGKYIDSDYLFGTNPESKNYAKPLIGSVKLVDSGSGYDYIVVESYENFLVKSVDATNYKVYVDTTVGNVSSSDSEIYVPVEEKYDYNITITKNEKDVSLSSIRKGNIISVKRNIPAAQKGVQNIDILVSDTKKSGKITEKSEDYVVIDSKQYTISPSIEGTKIGNDIAYNANGTFYMDAFGAIAYVELSAGGSYKYGYVVNFGIKNDDVANIKLFDYTSKKDVLYDFNTRVELNGLTCNDSKDIETAILNGAKRFNESSAGISKLYGQPVKYIVNGSGKITDFITVDYATDTTMNTIKYVEKAEYNSTNRYFDVNGDKIKVDSKTIFMEIPKKDKDGKVDIEAITRRDLSYFKNLYQYEIHMIGTTDTGSISVVLAYDANVDKDVHFGSPTYIVKEIKDVYENEENKTRLTLINFQTGAESSVFCSNKEYIAQVEKGDVIRFGKDSKGEINKNVYIYMDLSKIRAVDKTKTGAANNGNMPAKTVSFESNSNNDYYSDANNDNINDYLSNYPFRKVITSSSSYENIYRNNSINSIDNYYVHLLGVPYQITDNSIQITDLLPAEFDNPETTDVVEKEPSKENNLLVTATSSTYFHTISDTDEITTVKGSTDDNNIVGTIYSYTDQPETFNFIYIYMVDEVLKAVYIIK